jgi:hypothetical protein
LERERREKEERKKERYLQKHPEMRQKLKKDAANSDEEPKPAAMVEQEEDEEPEKVDYFKSETPHLIDTEELQQFNAHKHNVTDFIQPSPEKPITNGRPQREQFSIQNGVNLKEELRSEDGFLVTKSIGGQPFCAEPSRMTKRDYLQSS